MKITTGQKGKKNNILAVRVKVLDTRATPARYKQFSVSDAPGIEDVFNIVLEGTRKEIELRATTKKPARSKE